MNNEPNQLSQLFMVLSTTLKRHSISEVIEALNKLDGVKPVPKKPVRPSQKQLQEYYTELIMSGIKAGKLKL